MHRAIVTQHLRAASAFGLAGHLSQNGPIIDESVYSDLLRFLNTDLLVRGVYLIESVISLDFSGPILFQDLNPFGVVAILLGEGVGIHVQNPLQFDPVGIRVNRGVLALHFESDQVVPIDVVDTVDGARSDSCCHSLGVIIALPQHAGSTEVPLNQEGIWCASGTHRTADATLLVNVHELIQLFGLALLGDVDSVVRHQIAPAVINGNESKLVLAFVHGHPGIPFEIIFRVVDALDLPITVALILHLDGDVVVGVIDTSGLVFEFHRITVFFHGLFELSDKQVSVPGDFFLVDLHVIVKVAIHIDLGLRINVPKIKVFEFAVSHGLDLQKFLIWLIIVTLDGSTELVAPHKGFFKVSHNPLVHVFS